MPFEFIDKECFRTRKGSGEGKINSCQECCRYNTNCHIDITNDSGMLSLGYEIIYYICEDYLRAYRDCAKNTMKKAEKWLRSERPMLLSMERYDGVTMLEHLQAECEKQFGKFDERYEKFQIEHKKILKDLQEQLKVATTKQERTLLKEKIGKEKVKLTA